MKKFITKLLPILAGMMVFSAVPAFAQTSQEAKAVYDELEAKSQTMSNSNMYIQLNMNMTAGGESIDLSMAMNALTKNMFTPENLEMLSKNIVWIADEELSFVTWYKDGYSYTDMMGQKIKSKMDMAQAMNSSLALASTMGSSSDLLSDISLHTEGDKRVLTYRMDDAKMNAYMQQVFTQAGLDSMLQGMKITARNIKGSYTLTPDNFYSSATIDMAVDVSMEGETMSMYINGFIDILEHGDGVQIVLPSPAGYIDAEEMMAQN